MVSTPVLVFIVLAAVLIVVLLVWVFVWPAIKTDRNRSQTDAGASRPTGGNRMAKASQHATTITPRRDKIDSDSENRSLASLGQVRNFKSLRVDQPSKLGKDAEIAFEQLRNGLPQKIFTLETDGISVLGEKVFVDTEIDNADQRSDNNWWKKASHHQVRLFKEETGELFELDEMTPHQVSNFKYFQSYNEYPFLAIIGNRNPNVGVFFLVEDDKVYYNQRKDQGTLELVLAPSPFSCKLADLLKVKNKNAVMLVSGDSYVQLTPDQSSAFESLENGLPQNLFKLEKDTITCSGVQVCVKLDENVEEYYMREKWWLNLDHLTSLSLCSVRAGQCRSLSEYEQKAFRFFQTYNEYPFESLVERKELGRHFSVTKNQVSYLSGPNKRPLYLQQSSEGGLGRLYEVRNHARLAIKIHDGVLPLSPYEQSEFENLRRGFDNGAFKLQNDSIVSTDRGEVVIQDLEHNEDARPNDWWWKSIDPDQVRFLDHGHLFTLDEGRAQVSNFKFFKRYNEFPFQALQEFDEATRLGTNYQIKPDNRLVYLLSRHGEEWEVVDTKEKSYLAGAIDAMVKLLSAYDRGYRFPSWSIQAVIEEYHKYMTPTRVFYRANADINIVKLLTNQREPVNIEMKRSYKKDDMKSYFGYETGAYQNVQQPAPNIAIYTFTKVLVDVKKQQYRDVHILHAIGLAFDHIEQADYIYYMGLGAGDRRKQVVAFYASMFHTVFQACLHLNLGQLVMSMVGANNFATLYQDDSVQMNKDQFREQIWWPTWQTVASDYKQVRVSFMGVSKKEKCQFPKCVLKYPSALFVNAWDCWSIVGNGNAQDQSLDGFVGRSSTAALTSWPRTNMYMHDGCYIPLE